MSIEFAGPRVKIKIINCPTCDGWGEVGYDEYTSGHEFEHKKKPCVDCDGSGRLIETTTIEQKPFKEQLTTENEQ